MSDRVVHYDSPDWRLLRWGASLCHSNGNGNGDGHGWILCLPEAKSGHGTFPREHTFPGDAESVPPEALDLLTTVLRGVRPEPVTLPERKKRPEPEIVVPKIDCDSHATDVIIASLGSSVARLVRIDPLLRTEPTVERVHEARVGARRLRSHLKTFRPLLHGAWSDNLRERLRWFGDVLSGARDADVLLADITKRAMAMPGQRRHVEALLEPYRKQREDAYDALAAVLRSPRYVTLIDALIAAARTPQFMPHGYKRVAPQLDDLMQPAWHRLRKSVRAAGPEPRDHDLHGIRIKSKHLRYAAEALIPVAGSAAKAFAKRVEALQNVLGEQHDAVVAYRALHERPQTPQCAFLAEEIAAAEQAVATDRRNRWRPRWEKLRTKTDRFW